MYGKHADILSKQCLGGHVSRVRFLWIGILARPVCSVVAALMNSNQKKVLKLIDADSKTISSINLVMSRCNSKLTWKLCPWRPFGVPMGSSFLPVSWSWASWVDCFRAWLKGLWPTSKRYRTWKHRNCRNMPCGHHTNHTNHTNQT